MLTKRSRVGRLNDLTRITKAKAKLCTDRAAIIQNLIILPLVDDPLLVMRINISLLPRIDERISSGPATYDRLVSRYLDYVSKR